MMPETIEDAFIISESAAEKLKTTQVIQAIINTKRYRSSLSLEKDL